MQMTALIAALGSAAGFAVSTALQHHAAGGAPATVEGSSGRLLSHLLRRPWWLVGQTVALVSFGLHAFALQSGALAVVQPIVVSGVVFAVPLRAALSRRRPQTVEIRAVAITAIGLVSFLVVSRATLGLRDRWLADRQRFGQLAHRALTVSQLHQNRTAISINQRRLTSVLFSRADSME